MFSGIVEMTGIVKNIEKMNDNIELSITPLESMNDLNVGDSVAVNGVCLTITEIFQGSFKVAVIPETLRLTNLGLLQMQEAVNLERSIKADSRIGGHFVQGHVDQTSQITALTEKGGEFIVTFNLLPQLAQYIVHKGYVTIDGMSLTVMDINKNNFSVALIPHTRQITIASHYRLGTYVNIEVDILGKYIKRLLNSASYDEKSH